MANGETATLGRDLGQLFAGGHLAGLGDGELLERFARRDEGSDRAFAALLERHGPAVLAACRRFGGDHGLAEDAFQATFIVLARKAASVRVGDSLRPWLVEVARRTALKGRAGEARRRAREIKVAVPESTDPPRSGLPDDLGAIVRAEVGRLPAKLRDPVRLFYLEGRTQEETAAALGWPVGSVSGRLFEARKLLRDRLTRRGVAPAGWLAIPAVEVAPAVPTALRLAALDSVIAAPARAAAGTPAVLAARVLRGMAAARLATGVAGLAVAVVALGVGAFSSSGPHRAATPGDSTAEGDLRGAPPPDPAIARPGTARSLREDSEAGAWFGGPEYTMDGWTTVTVGDHASYATWTTQNEIWKLRVDGRDSTLSPDGRVLATFLPGLLRFHDPDDGRELRRAPPRVREILDHFAFTPDGSNLLAIGTTPATNPAGFPEAALVAYDARTGAERWRRPAPFVNARALAIAPDGRTFAIAVPDRGPGECLFSTEEPDRAWIVLLDTLDGSERRRIAVDRFDVASLTFAPDGRTLAAGVGDRTVRFYDPSSGREQRPRLGEGQAMPPPAEGKRARRGAQDAARAASALAFSPDGSTLVSGEEGVGYLDGRLDESAIVIWDVPGRRQRHRNFGHHDGVCKLVFAPDGRTFASSGGDVARRFWDVATGRELAPSPVRLSR